MRVLILTVILLIVFASAYSQGKRWAAGFGISYCNCVARPGINLNVTYRVAGNFFIGPDFSAFLSKKFHRFNKKITHREVEYNLNAHQLFMLNKTLSAYPLLGVNFSQTIHEVAETTPEIEWVYAANVGGGMEYDIEQLKVFLETKYVTHSKKIDFAIGIFFPI